MDGGGENRFLAGGAEISRRGGGITAAPARTKAKAPTQNSIGAFYGSRLFSSNNGEAKKLLRSISNP